MKILSTHGAESLDDGTKSFVKQQLSDFASKLAPSEHIHKGGGFLIFFIDQKDGSVGPLRTLHVIFCPCV